MVFAKLLDKYRYDFPKGAQTVGKSGAGSKTLPITAVIISILTTGQF
jgi:hypothetical protein